MTGLVCKRCGEADYTKAGIARGHQRYRCRGCGLHFTDTVSHGRSPETKAMAVQLYVQGQSLRGIGRVLSCSNVSVLRWIRKEAQSLPEPVIPAGPLTMAIDEM